HHHTRERFITAGQSDERIVAVSPHHQFHAVGDNLAADQRRLHAFVAHPDAVAHGYSHKLARGSAGFCHSCSYGFGLAVEGQVTGRSFVPGAGDTDKRLVDLCIAKTHAPQECPVRRPGGSLCYVMAVEGTIIKFAHGRWDYLLWDNADEAESARHVNWTARAGPFRSHR